MVAVEQVVDQALVHDTAAGCTLCPLAQTRTAIVASEGPWDARLVVVADNPGEVEDSQGRVYRGAGGRLLRRLLREAGIAWGEVFFLSAIRCRSFKVVPAGTLSVKPKIKDVRTCRTWVDAELAALDPHVILALGESALASLTGTTKQSVSDWRGEVLEVELPTRSGVRPVKVIPSFQPAYALRFPGAEATILADLARAKYEARSRGHLAPPGTTTYVCRTVEEVTALVDYLLLQEEIAFDTETAGPTRGGGLDRRYYRPLCFSFSCEEGEGWVVPLLGRLPREKWNQKTYHFAWDDVEPVWTPAEYDAVVAQLKRLLEDPGPRKIGQNCVTPDTRVLTEDLRWVPLDDVRIGDVLAGFDEDAGANHRRCWRKAVVEEKRYREAEVFEIRFVDGSVVKATADHPFLVYRSRQRGKPPSGLQWRTVGDLARRPDVSYLFAKITDVWEADRSYEAGWLAGFFDGEGCLTTNGRSRSCTLVASQVEGPTLELACRRLEAKGFRLLRHRHTNANPRPMHQPVQTVVIQSAVPHQQGGSQREILRFLGQFRPERLVPKWWERERAFLCQPQAAVSIRSLGVQRVVDIQTSTATFIAEGFATHNCKYDLHACATLGIRPVNIAGDTMIAHACLDENQPHNLEYLRSAFTTLPRYERWKDAMPSEAAPYCLADPETELWPYAAGDTDVVYRVMPQLRERLADPEERGPALVYRHIAMPMVEALYEIERVGMHVDRGRLNALQDQYTQWIKEEERRLFDAAGHRFNYDAPGQLARVLFDEQGLEGYKRTLSGADWSTDREVMEILEASYPDNQVIKSLKRLRKLVKTRENYLAGESGTEGMLLWLDDDGWIRTTFNPARVVTGRLSSEKPTLHTISKKDEFEADDDDHDLTIRSVFDAPPGHLLLEADYSQLELRIQAYETEEDVLLEAFGRGKAVDQHALTAAQVYGVSLEQVTKEQRGEAKKVNFGYGYGGGIPMIQRVTRWDKERAWDFLNKLKAAYPKTEAKRKEAEYHLLARGYVQNRFGRRRRFPTFREAYETARREGPDRVRARIAVGRMARQAYNFWIQSTGSDVLSLATIELVLHSAVLKRLGVIPCLTLHDALYFYVPEACVDEAVGEIKRVMEGVTRRIPALAHWYLPVDISAGYRWGQPVREWKWSDPAVAALV